jgi:hypothetical protein
VAVFLCGTVVGWCCLLEQLHVHMHDCMYCGMAQRAACPELLCPWVGVACRILTSSLLMLSLTYVETHNSVAFFLRLMNWFMQEWLFPLPRAVCCGASANLGAAVV